MSNPVPEDGDITVEVEGSIIKIGIRRPDKLNGFTPSMFAQLSAAYGRLEDEPDLRVGVVFGHGDHFTAGLDLPKFTEAMKSGKIGTDHNGIDPFGLGKRRCSKPVVVAVSGITYTAGIELMLAAEIVVAADNSRFSQLEPKRGIMATGGATVRFAERGGYGNAMYHLLVVDEFDAAEAHRVGLVQEVVPAGTELDRAIELATKISRMAPLAVTATIESVRTSFREGEVAAIRAFPETQARLSATDDAAEGVRSFVERRDPNFTGT